VYAKYVCLNKIVEVFPLGMYFEKNDNLNVILVRFVILLRQLFFKSSPSDLECGGSIPHFSTCMPSGFPVSIVAHAIPFKKQKMLQSWWYLQIPNSFQDPSGLPCGGSLSPRLIPVLHS
jgi:hypothetical protein